MAKTVSNEALWEKLSEVDKKLEKLSEVQKSSTLSDEQAISIPNFQQEKDEIIAEIQEQTHKCGTHSDINFRAVNQNIGTANENITKVFNIVARIRKQQKEVTEQPQTDCHYFDFSFFKVRKSSFVIAVLGLLVFMLTVFSMKQQNDYALLMNEYYRQSIEIWEMKVKK